MKTDTFGSFVGFHDSIQRTRNGITYRVRVEHDSQARIDDDDVHPTERPDDVTDETWEKIQTARAAYFRNEWHYVGLIVSAERDGWERDHLASCWGLEANYPGTENEYLNDVAAELIQEAEDALSLEAGMGELWERDDVQFPRLLAEICATQDSLNLPVLAESMDLTVEEVNELFDRADAVWEAHKKTLP